jgi:hypothetical protein
VSEGQGVQLVTLKKSPRFRESDLDLPFEEGTPRVRVPEAARLLVVVDRVHRHPVLVAIAQVARRYAWGQCYDHFMSIFLFPGSVFRNL